MLLKTNSNSDDTSGSSNGVGTAIDKEKQPSLEESKSVETVSNAQSDMKTSSLAANAAMNR